MLMLTVLPAIKFVWWQGCVLPWVESMWWQDMRSGIIIPFRCCRANFVHIGCHHCGLVHRIEVKFQNGHCDGEVGGRTSSSSYYDAVLCSKSRLLHSIGNKIKNKNKQTNKQKTWQATHQVPRCWPHSTACRSPGHEILGRPGLMVISPEMFNTEGDLSFLTYFSKPEPERAPWPTAVGGGYVIKYGGRNWMYPPPTAVGRGALYTLLLSPGRRHAVNYPNYWKGNLWCSWIVNEYSYIYT